MDIFFSITTLTCFTVTDCGSTQLNHHKQSLMETNRTIKLILKLCLLHLQPLGSFWRKSAQFAFWASSHCLIYGKAGLLGTMDCAV